jgi:hypothetical protein
MSLFRVAGELAARHLPAPVVQSLQRFKQKLPIRLMQSPPIVQTYINDGQVHCFIGLHNFYSCLLAETVTEANVELCFHSASGRRLLVHREPLAHLGACAIDVAALFRKRGVDSAFGVVTAQITPAHPRRKIYRELGQVAAHFFIFYCDDGSVAQVHPLSSVMDAATASDAFLSSQLISTAGLQEVSLFQYNPCTAARSLEHKLLDARSKEVVARHKTTLSPLGAERIRFAVSALSPRPDQLLVAVDGLPGNAKPMLQRLFANGLRSMSHS